MDPEFRKKNKNTGRMTSPLKWPSGWTGGKRFAGESRGTKRNADRYPREKEGIMKKKKRKATRERTCQRRAKPALKKVKTAGEGNERPPQKLPSTERTPRAKLTASGTTRGKKKTTKAGVEKSTTHDPPKGPLQKKSGPEQVPLGGKVQSKKPVCSLPF